ncbi:MAG: dTDP-4-dehydrorhamnose reductase [Actinomycetota bacterium]|nr:dTDP-4-dehydrorhamnose reductase [Actinomycetota bacterium]
MTGAGGQVGIALTQHLPSARFSTHRDLDVTDRSSVRRAVADVDVVIHLAAMTDVDRCEDEPEAAMEVNAQGTDNVCAAAMATGARVVYLSTDYVFDGAKGSEYVEEDPPNPLNVYGRSKLAGEDVVKATDDYQIVRTSWVIGKGRNFVRTILRIGREEGTVSVVDDQRGRPTFATDLAAGLAALVRSRFSGTVHLAGAGDSCTWADLADAALQAAGIQALVERVDTETYAARASRRIAPRPRNSALALAKAESLGIRPPPWRESLSDYLEGAA